MGNNASSEKDMSGAKEVVEEAIASNRVMVFSKSYCPYCRKAKQALSSILPPNGFGVMEIENRPDCAAIQDYLLSKTGARSVPRVFVDGECIGGGDETASMVANGSMEELLKKKGIL